MNNTAKAIGSADAGLLIARLVLGVVMIAHGWQKFSTFTVAGTQQSFAQMGMPLPDLAAIGVIALEIFGGAAVILGLFTRVIGVLYAVVMAGALFMVHLTAGFYSSDGGFEYVLVLAGISLALAATGPGKLSIDHPIFGRRKAAAQRAEAEDVLSV